MRSELAAAWMLQGGASLAGRHKRIGVRLLHEIAFARAVGRMGAMA